jgi:uncharacterized membrane protein YgcG
VVGGGAGQEREDRPAPARREAPQPAQEDYEPPIRDSFVQSSDLGEFDALREDAADRRRGDLESDRFEDSLYFGEGGERWDGGRRGDGWDGGRRGGSGGGRRGGGGGRRGR